MSGVAPGLVPAIAMFEANLSEGELGVKVKSRKKIKNIRNVHQDTSLWKESFLFSRFFRPSRVVDRGEVVLLIEGAPFISDVFCDVLRRHLVKYAGGF